MTSDQIVGLTCAVFGLPDDNIIMTITCNNNYRIEYTRNNYLFILGILSNVKWGSRCSVIKYDDKICYIKEEARFLILENKRFFFLNNRLCNQ